MSVRIVNGNFGDDEEETQDVDVEDVDSDDGGAADDGGFPTDGGGGSQESQESNIYEDGGGSDGGGSDGGGGSGSGSGGGTSASPAASPSDPKEKRDWKAKRAERDARKAARRAGKGRPAVPPVPATADVQRLTPTTAAASVDASGKSFSSPRVLYGVTSSAPSAAAPKVQTRSRIRPKPAAPAKPAVRPTASSRRFSGDHQVGAEFGLTSYREDVDAINIYFQSAPAANAVASDVKLQWATFWSRYNAASWFDQNFSADLWNEARGIRDRLNAANGDVVKYPTVPLRAEDLGQSKPVGGALGNLPSDIADKGLVTGLWTGLPTAAKAGVGVVGGLLLLKLFK